MDFQVCRRPRKIKLALHPLSDRVDLKIKLKISNVRFSDSSIELISPYVRKDFRRSISDIPQVIQPASFGEPHLVKRRFGDPVFSEFFSNEMVSLIEVEEACTKIIWF